MARQSVISAALACAVSAGCLSIPDFRGSDNDASADQSDAAADADPVTPDAELDATAVFVPLCDPNDIVAHWNFEGALTTAVDVAGDNDGPLASGTTAPLPVAGQFGQAARFRPQPRGFFVVPDDPALDLAAGSLEIWVMWHIDDAEQVVVARDASSNPSEDADGHLRVGRGSDNRMQVRLQDADGEVALSSTIVAKDQWIHLVLNWAGSGSELYVGGELESSSATAFSWAAAQNPFVIGTDQNNAQPGPGTGTPTDYLDGRIDEIVLCSATVRP